MIGLLIALLVVGYRSGLYGEALMPKITEVAGALHTYYIITSILLSIFMVVVLIASFLKNPALFFKGIGTSIKIFVLQALYLIGTSVTIIAVNNGDNQRLILASVMLVTGCVIQICSKFTASVTLKS